MKSIKITDSNFVQEFCQLLSQRASVDLQIEESVKQIVAQVRETGDQALIELTLKFDGVNLGSIPLEVTPEEREAARKKLKKWELEAIMLAAERIGRFHQRQRENSWFCTGTDGEILGQLCLPIQRAGIYVPGGLAAYPSSVLMNAIPARIAGVEQIIMCTPPLTQPSPLRGEGKGEGEVNPYLLAAAEIAGVNRIFRIGGAQAVAAMAYGTQTVPQVDKIVGPGNTYVANAKRLVFGQVGIDMVAGPSEILIVADKNANPAWIAADMLSQAEHDPLAQPILITDSPALPSQVEAEIAKQLTDLSRAEIARKSIEERAAVILTENLSQAMELANRLAPEHLELAVSDPWAWLGKVRNAGAVFLGQYTPEPIGDYIAGPNHVLPTNSTARFSSPLGVYDFMKRTSVICYNREALVNQGELAVGLAKLEGLEAHAKAIEKRLSEAGDK